MVHTVMTAEAINTIKRIIAGNSEAVTGHEGLTNEAILEYDLLMDSMDKLHAIYEIEREFNVCIDDKEMAKLVTIGDVINCVNRLSGGK